MIVSKITWDDVERRLEILRRLGQATRIRADYGDVAGEGFDPYFFESLADDIEKWYTGASQPETSSRQEEKAVPPQPGVGIGERASKASSQGGPAAGPYPILQEVADLYADKESLELRTEWQQAEIEAWRMRAEAAEKKVRNMEIKEEQRYLETPPVVAPPSCTTGHCAEWRRYMDVQQERFEALADELFWTRRRAEQAEEDAGRWLERLSDLEDLVEAAGWNLRRAK